MLFCYSGLFGVCVCRMMYAKTTFLGGWGGGGNFPIWSYLTISTTCSGISLFGIVYYWPAQHSPLKSRSPSLNLFFAQHYFCNYSTTEAIVLENIHIYVYSNVKKARLKVLIWKKKKTLRNLKNYILSYF